MVSCAFSVTSRGRRYPKSKWQWSDVDLDVMPVLLVEAGLFSKIKGQKMHRQPMRSQSYWWHSNACIYCWTEDKTEEKDICRKSIKYRVAIFYKSCAQLLETIWQLNNTCWAQPLILMYVTLNTRGTQGPRL